MIGLDSMRPLNLIFLIVAWGGGLVALGWAIDRYGGKRLWVKLCIGLFTLLCLALLVFFNDFLKEVGPASWADVADQIMPDGYAMHSVETLITVQDNWLIGEAKDCSSSPLSFKVARLIDEEPGYVALGFNCDDGPRHSIKVTLYGHLNQPDHKIAYWRCTRESEGFTCRQTGAE